MARPIWTVDGVALPRNPDKYDYKWDKASTTYEKMADGSETRVTTPQLISGADLVLTFSYADRKLHNALMQYFNPTYPPGTPHKITVDGLLPAQQAYVFFDTPQKTMSQEVYTTKLGEGGTKNDLVINLRMQGPWMRSVSSVPGTTPTAAQVAGWFGGPVGNGTDGIPVWQTNPWQVTVNSAAQVFFNMENLGTAPWSPVIRINGPFTTISLRYNIDIDGTGLFISFNWTGAALATGSYLLFDTATKRLWTVIGGVKTEVYTFSYVTLSNGLPYPYVLPLSPGITNFTYYNATGYGAGTSIDFSNAGTEKFRYW